MAAAVEREMAGAGAEAAVDWFLHPVLAALGDGTAAEIAALAAAGHTSVKVFLSNPDSRPGRPAWPRRSRRPGRPGPDVGALRGRRDAHAGGPSS